MSSCFLVATLQAQEPMIEASLDDKLEGLYQRQQFDDAVALLTAHLKESPDAQDRRIGLSRLLDYLGKSDESIQNLQDGLRKKEGDGELYWYLGQAWLARGDDGPNVTKSGGMVTYSPSTMTDEEEALWKKAEYQKAAGAFRSVLEANPEYEEGAELLVRALKGALPAAEFGEEVKSLTKKFPESRAISLLYSDLLIGEKAPEKAITLLKGLLAKSPRNGVIHGKLAAAYQASGDEDAAAGSLAQGSFYGWMPPFTKTEFSKETAVKIVDLKAGGEKLKKTVDQLISDKSQVSTDLMAAVCWHHLAHGTIENSCFAELEKRGEGALLVSLIENAQSICTSREGGQALARMKHPEALRILSRLVESDQRPVWIFDAASALEVLGDDQAVGILIKTADPSFKESSRQRSEEEASFMGKGPYNNRVRCILALGSFDTVESKAALMEAAKNPDLAMVSEFALYRVTKDEAHLEKGFSLVEDEWFFRHRMKHYIETKIGDEASLKALKDWEEKNPVEVEEEDE